MVVNNSNRKLDLFITYSLFAGFFLFLVLGILSFDADPDFIADKFLGAAVCLFFSIFHKRMGMKWYSITAIVFLLFLHHLKLYGNVYFGLEFDMIIHFTGGFCISLAAFQFLSNCEGKQCQSVPKLMFFSIFVAAGIGSLLEIVEYFAYANLPPGGGILHFGLGDTGEWADASWDMICNFLGAITSSIIMAISFLIKKYKI